MEDNIVIHNAGLVLVNSYIPMLFDRLDLTKNGVFLNNELQLSAVHYLQHVATGQSYTEEHWLIFNKVLIGIPLDSPIEAGVVVTETQKEIMEGLINAMIGHWTAIGDSSIEGFRGNWLVRDGILREYDDRWELTIEKRAYDLLISKSPFSFSIIKYSWMPKPIHVFWPF